MSKYRNSYSSYNSSRSSYDKPALREEENLEPETKTGIVIISDFFNLLNVRSSPKKTTDNVVTTIKKGTKVTILETLQDWYKIETPSGEIGYVDSNYIEV